MTVETIMTGTGGAGQTDRVPGSGPIRTPPEAPRDTPSSLIADPAGPTPSRKVVAGRVPPDGVTSTRVFQKDS